MDLWAFFASGIGYMIGVWIVGVGVWALGVYLSLRLLYTVIWRAVRRGLREFHGAASPPAAALYPPAWTTEPSRRERRPSNTPQPIREQPGPRDWKPGGSLFE